METPSQSLKTCTKCKTEKPQSEFYLLSTNRRRNPKWSIIVAAVCKECTRQVTKQRRDMVLGNPETRVIQKAKDQRYCKGRHDARRKAVFAAYGGPVCACCSETEERFLSLDHIYNDGAQWRRERFGNRMAAGYHTYQWLVKNGFPPGFQVLCMNCQHGKRMCGGICPHQSRSNDYPLAGVEASASKRTAPEQPGEDIVFSVAKVTAA